MKPASIPLTECGPRAARTHPSVAVSDNARRGQGPLGACDSININGTEIAPVGTWDAKSLT
jgi:hypothetical protein